MSIMPKFGSRDITSKLRRTTNAVAQTAAPLNAAQKRALKTAQMAVYLKQVGRKAQKGVEPNDRRESYQLGEEDLEIPPAADGSVDEGGRRHARISR